MADNILEFSAKPNHISLPVHAVAASENKEISSLIIAKLLTKVDTLSSCLENLELERRSPGFRRRSRSKACPRESSISGLCWYYSTHGKNACRCTKPCSFVSTTLQILTIRWIIEEVCAKNLEATLLFLNFSKAFIWFHTREMMEHILWA